jgi:hypothetical protein
VAAEAVWSRFHLGRRRPSLQLYVEKCGFRALQPIISARREAGHLAVLLGLSSTLAGAASLFRSWLSLSLPVYFQMRCLIGASADSEAVMNWLCFRCHHEGSFKGKMRQTSSHHRGASDGPGARGDTDAPCSSCY